MGGNRSHAISTARRRASSCFKRLKSRGELKSYADGTVEGTSQAEVPSTEGPLAVWYSAQLARAVQI